MAASPRKRRCGHWAAIAAWASAVRLAGWAWLAPALQDAASIRPCLPIRSRTTAEVHQCAVLRRVGRHIDGIPDIAQPGHQDRMYECATADAAARNVSFETYLESITHKAQQWFEERHLVDRKPFQDALAEAIHSKGKLTLVLGGKNLGKSFVLNRTVEQLSKDEKTRVLIAFVDMRDHPSKPLFGALADATERALDRLDLSWAKEVASGLTSVIAWLEGGGDLMTYVLKVQSGLKDFLTAANWNGYQAAFVVDEANLALPGFASESQRSEASHEALPFFVRMTKQAREASVVLVSSELSYPYRLQRAGLHLDDIDNVIVAGEVSEDFMLELFTKSWGMGQALARELHAYFGGSVHYSYKALRLLAQQREWFTPFAVVETPGLPSCVEDAAARAHLMNICKQGYSYVSDVKADTGAELIAKEDIGGVISARALTFGLPADMWEGTTCEYAVIPSSSHMRFQICYALAAYSPQAQ